MGKDKLKIANPMGTVIGLLATAGARVNLMFERQGKPYDFIPHPTQPVVSQVRALSRVPGFLELLERFWM